MRFEDNGLGYAFTLSDDWRDASDHLYNPENIETKSYVSDRGLISIMVGRVEDHLLSIPSRKLEFEHYLESMGHTNIDSAVGTQPLGGEKNTILSEYSVQGKRQCMISAVHGDRQILIQFESNLNNESSKSDLSNLLDSFEYLDPSPSTRHVPMEDVRIPSPEYEIQTARTQGEREQALHNAGYEKVLERSGYKGYRRSLKEKKPWWKFWK